MRMCCVSLFAVGIVALLPAMQAIAQNEQPGSTIRLVSATEPAEAAEPPASLEEDPSPALPALIAAQRPQAAEPAQQPAPVPESELPQPEQAPQPAFKAPILPVAATAPASSAAAAQTSATMAAGRIRTPAGLYPSASSQATLSRLPGPTPVQPTPRQPQPARASKPFQGVQSEPAISPYLNLYRDDRNSTLPNYLTLVRPQVEQREAQRAQQQEIQNLRGQLQNMSSAPAARQSPSSRTSARYMDTAQFYGGMHR
jgi:hypothetical protein